MWQLVLTGTFLQFFSDILVLLQLSDVYLYTTINSIAAIFFVYLAVFLDAMKQLLWKPVKIR